MSRLASKGAKHGLTLLTWKYLLATGLPGRQSSEGKHGHQRQGRSEKAIEGVGRIDCQGQGDTEVW
jgi:hypothetical protein